MFTFFPGMAVLDPAGPIALGERSVIYTTLLLCAIVVVPVFVMLFLFAWRYRAGGPASTRKHAPNWDHDSVVAEVVWWVVPTLIVVCLSGIAWKSSHALDPYKKLPGTPFEVQVIALNWKWLFIYPELGIASVNELVIPQGVPVHLSLTADAPMNSFWVPQLAGQIMVMPGMSTQLNVRADIPGTFYGVSANISGEGFSGMNFTVRSLPPNEFEAWMSIARISPASEPLTDAAYATLAAPSSNEKVRYWAPVANNLYTTIANKGMGMSH